MQPPRAGQGFDHAATAFTWTVPILCGKPDGSTAGVKYGEGTTPDGMFAAPDNVAFDNQGRIPAAAGRVTSTSTESRRVQFALKLNF